mgnify:CR=1 FL=1
MIRDFGTKTLQNPAWAPAIALKNAQNRACYRVGMQDTTRHCPSGARSDYRRIASTIVTTVSDITIALRTGATATHTRRNN